MSTTASQAAGLAAYNACIAAAQTFNARKGCRQQCTLDTCPIDLSYWAYRPSLPANGLFLALFGLSLGCFVIQAVLSKRFLGFTVAMVSGCILEVVGYSGRIMSYFDPFLETGFLMQIICLTIAPAFLAAGLYFCLSRIVITFGPSNSRLPPLWYPRIFIPCDVVSLLLQAAGGGWASAATHQDRDPTKGNDIMIAGLAFQVITLAVFITLSLDFSLKTLKRVREMGKEGALDPTHAKLRASWAFKGFLIALAFCTLCIFTRSVYRVAELSEGWKGHLIQTQKYFVGLEGAIVGAGVLALNAFHPGMCFREGSAERRGLGFGRSRTEKDRRSGTESPGEVEGGVPTKGEAVVDRVSEI